MTDLPPPTARTIRPITLSLAHGTGYYDEITIVTGVLWGYAREGTGDMLEIAWSGSPRVLTRIERIYPDCKIVVKLPRGVEVEDVPDEVTITALVLTRPLGRPACRCDSGLIVRDLQRTGERP